MNIFNPYQNFYESYYFYSLGLNPAYFNYDVYLNSAKISSNIVLTENESKTPQKFVNEEKYQDTRSDSYPVNKGQNKQKMNIIKKQRKRVEVEKQAHVRKQKKISKCVKKVDMIQKEGRNSHSNILRKFFKLLSVKNQFKLTIEKIIKINNFNVKIDEFFEKMKERNIDHRNYIRVKQVRWLFQQSQNQITKIARILFKNYLDNYYIEHLLSSKKTDCKSIIFHLKGKRSICEEISGKNFLQNKEFEME